MAYIEDKSKSLAVYWRAQIALCESSGQSIAQYCRDKGLSVSSYHWWKRVLKQRSKSQDANPLFTEVLLTVPGDSAEALIEVALGEQRRIRVWPGFDRETLARVVQVLESMPC